MSLSEETIERIRKVIALERRLGFSDRAVLGGLESFLANQAPSLARHIANYSAKTPAERRQALEALEKALQRGESAPAPAAISPPGATEEEALRKPVRFAKGVGEQRARLLKKLGIETIEDLLLYLPRRIEDRRVVRKIGHLRHGDRATVVGRLRAVDTIKPRKNLEIIKAAVQDNTGVLFAVWFNQPWVKTQLEAHMGQRLALYGAVERAFGMPQMSNPVWEPEDEEPFLTRRLVPIYPATQGLTPAVLYRIIRENLSLYKPAVRDLLPQEIRERQGLLPKAEALEKIHFPSTPEEFERARRTLAFEELFLFQIGVALERQRQRRRSARRLSISDEELEAFLEALPFTLTRAQERALREIRGDLASGHPMNRLLQGDVGSGKTVVAAAAAYIAIKAGTQAAFMAPTEILARQHAERLAPLLEPLGVRCELLIGSLAPSQKESVRGRIAAGEVDLVIGTHALITEDVQFKKLGLVVIDEQHRFGVIQRAKLEEKGEDVHVLVMSATPIPRTITLTLYGQFEISIIDELPFPKDIRTYWVSEDKREEVYRLVAEEVRKGAQAYVVYPLIEESEELDLRAAAQMKEELEQTAFRGLRVGLLHGRMKDEEKQRIMEQLRRRELDVLVSTSIIEVGIDVPDASIMVIEHAERFGLSQLHQLRGRIGRQGQHALCFAIATAKTEEAQRRLRAFRDLSDGFEIAEEDLKIRGPGELLGVAQHGLDTTFKVADLIRDLPLMKAAREEAFRLVEQEPNTPLIQEFERRFGEKFELARV